MLSVGGGPGQCGECRGAERHANRRCRADGFAVFGFANLATGEPVSPQTLFQIGSITKTMTSAAVMALVLFFVPDPRQGVRELVRVVKSGGMIAAYQWDLAGGGFPLQPILDAVHAAGYRSQQPPSA